MVIRPEFLEWCVLHNGILAARELFNELKDLEPQCKNLYTSMILFEKTQSSSITKIGTIRKLYNDACNKFGDRDIGKCIVNYLYNKHTTDFKLHEQKFGLNVFVMNILMVLVLW